jgi:hypothetical protein
MKNPGFPMIAACVAGTLCLATVALAQEAAKPAVPPKGEAVVSSTEVTATVLKVDQKTREVTLKKQDGTEYSFVAGDAVKNLAQVNVGDVIVATYTEAIAYEVKKGGKPAELKAAGIVPDLMKRGAVRTVYDGRYLFARYFSPKQHNRPTTLEELLRFNDVELFDTQADSLEMTNLAAPAVRNRELLLAMNDKLNRLIDDEVGEDVGQMLPGGVDGGWVATPAVHDL